MEKKANKSMYWMNFKQDANSLPNLSKDKWLSLDMHAETIGVILLIHVCIHRMMPGKRRRGAPGWRTH